MRNRRCLFVGLMMSVAIAYAAPVRADIPGTYSTEQRVDGGAIKYTLNLKSNGDAELVSERKDYPSLSRSNIEDYGNILETLDRDGKVRHTGTWRRRDDRNRDFSIRFERIYHGSDDHYESMNSNGTVDGGSLSLFNWRPSIYGRSTSFRFSRNGRRGSNDLVIGLGVLALGSIIASAASHHGSPSSEVRFDQLDYKTGGQGTYTVDGTRNEIKEVDIKLRRNGTARIGITLKGDGFFLEGRWSRSGGKNIRVEVTRTFDSVPVRGEGTLIMRNSREVERMDLRYANEDDPQSFRIEFASGKG